MRVVYVGLVGNDGCRVVVIERPAKGITRMTQLDPRLALRNHSATGFGWGYLGSGPAQLALAILADATNRTACAVPLKGANPTPEWETREANPLDLYQMFKLEVISKLPNAGWELSLDEVIGWLRRELSGRELLDSVGPGRQSEKRYAETATRYQDVD